MSVLFITNSINLVSENWLIGHIQMLKAHICCILVFDIPNSKKLYNIPVETLLPDIDLKVRVLKKINRFSEKEKNNFYRNKFNRILQKYKPKKLLIEYLNVAVRLQKYLTKLPQTIFVHCHGYDTTWNFRLHSSPEKPHFSNQYITKVKCLAEKVHFIANSKHLAQRLYTIGITKEKVSVKYMSVKAAKKIKVHKDTDELKILFVGRLIDCKGPDYVIHSLKLLRDKGVNATLTIIGDGPLKIACELLCRQLKIIENIKIIGEVNHSQLNSYLLDADIFTLHSNYGLLSHQEEALGVSIIEAMAVGLPVVTAKSGGVSEVVIDNSTGLLVAPYDIEGHSQAFFKLQDTSIRQKYGRNAIDRVSKVFSNEHEKDNFFKILGIQK